MTFWNLRGWSRSDHSSLSSRLISRPAMSRVTKCTHLEASPGDDDDVDDDDVDDDDDDGGNVDYDDGYNE